MLIDQCLEYNYRVYTIPSVTDWENQKEISQKVKNIQIEDLLERDPIVLNNESISKQLEHKTILITGTAGSIGSEIVRQVLNFNPEKVIILDKAETPLHHIGLEVLGIKSNTVIHSVIVDIRNKAALEKVFKQYRPQMIYRCRRLQARALDGRKSVPSHFDQCRGNQKPGRFGLRIPSQ